MSKDNKNELKIILKLVKEIHSKILEPSTTSKVTTGIKDVVTNVPNMLRQFQQGGKTTVKKSKVKKNNSRKR